MYQSSNGIQLRGHQSFRIRFDCRTMVDGIRLHSNTWHVDDGLRSDYLQYSIRCAYQYTIIVSHSALGVLVALHCSTLPASQR